MRLVSPLLSALVATVMGLRLQSLLAAEAPLWGRIAIVSIASVVVYSVAQVFIGRAMRRMGARNGTEPAS